MTAEEVDFQKQTIPKCARSRVSASLETSPEEPSGGWSKALNGAWRVRCPPPRAYYCPHSARCHPRHPHPCRPHHLLPIRPTSPVDENGASRSCPVRFIFAPTPVGAFFSTRSRVAPIYPKFLQGQVIRVVTNVETQSAEISVQAALTPAVAPRAPRSRAHNDHDRALAERPRIHRTLHHDGHRQCLRYRGDCGVPDGNSKPFGSGRFLRSDGCVFLLSQLGMRWL